MRRGLMTLALAAGLVIAGGGFTTAQAESFWHATGGVRIGGIHFTMGYHSAPRHRRFPGRYYRTKHRLKHRGYRCGRLCYRRGGYYNHHQSCGLLGVHMARHGYAAWNYAPPYPVYGYGDRYGRFDRYNRYDSYRDHRYYGDDDDDGGGYYDDDDDDDDDDYYDRDRRRRRRW